MTKVNGKENTDNSIKRGDNIWQRNKRSNIKRLNTVEDREKKDVEGYKKIVQRETEERICMK